VTGRVGIEDLRVLLGTDGKPLSRRTVERWLADGRLTKAGLREANRVGHARQFDAASVEQVLWRRRVGGLRRIA
jgi:hypothetical protein